MILVKIHLSLALIFQVTDEMWNLNHPRINPNDDYFLCNWEKEDFYPFKFGNKWKLKEYRKEDGSFKRKAREKYYDKTKKTNLQRIGQLYYNARK